MKIGTMFGDVVQSLFKPPATERYPFERHEAPERLRGELVYDPSKCVGCQLCAKDCPSKALELITIDKTSKRYALLYHVDRCTFCAQCEQSCRFGCLALSNNKWELASLDKDDFNKYYGRDEDIQAYLARKSARNMRPDME